MVASDSASKDDSSNYSLPLTIIHTTCHREFGGLEKRVYNESCAMLEKGHRIVIAAPEYSPLIVKCRKKLLNSSVVCVPMEFTAKSAFKDFFTLRQLYIKFKPDVLNTHGNTDAKIALSAAWNSNIPCTILSRHISADVRPSWYNKILYNRLCSHVFTTADYTTNHLVSTLGVDPEKIFTLPSGVVPPSEMADRQTARVDLADQLNVNRDSRFIGFVGRVSEDKGVKSIIDAFLSIAEKIPNYHLVIVGGEDNILKGRGKLSHSITFIEQLRKMVNQSGYQKRVHFTGFKEDTWQYYRAFDCNILASKEVEGISQSLLEAMYARCPVAGSQVGGTCDIIIDGETGLLFRPERIQEIEKAVLQILSDKSATTKRIEKAFSMVNEKYTIGSMVKHILNIYQNCKCQL